MTKPTLEAKYADGGWRPIATAPDGVVVETKIHDGAGCRNEQRLKQVRGLWWFSDMSMYVYYTPTHWRPVAGTANESDPSHSGTPEAK